MTYKIKRNLHTDFSVFEENKLPARSYFIPFSDETALDGSDFKNERYQSDRTIMLSGEWDFAYYKKLSEVPDPFDSETVRFDKVVTPSTWQRTGYDRIAYINTRYPFPKKPPKIPEDVATGIYRKTVFLPQYARQIITFLGVAGALALYVNGAYVGYSEGSHNAAEFDITSSPPRAKTKSLPSSINGATAPISSVRICSVKTAFSVTLISPYRAKAD